MMKPLKRDPCIVRVNHIFSTNSTYDWVCLIYLSGVCVQEAEPTVHISPKLCEQPSVFDPVFHLSSSLSLKRMLNDSRGLWCFFFSFSSDTVVSSVYRVPPSVCFTVDIQFQLFPNEHIHWEEEKIFWNTKWIKRNKIMSLAA